MIGPYVEPYLEDLVEIREFLEDYCNYLRFQQEYPPSADKYKWLRTRTYVNDIILPALAKKGDWGYGSPGFEPDVA